jgi:homoserine acetyltransferase
MIVLMADPNWNGGFYYDHIPPHTGLKLARRKLTLFLILRRVSDFSLKKLQQSPTALGRSGTSALVGRCKRPQSQVNNVRLCCAQTFSSRPISITKRVPVFVH